MTHRNSRGGGGAMKLGAQRVSNPSPQLFEDTTHPQVDYQQQRQPQVDYNYQQQTQPQDSYHYQQQQFEYNNHQQSYTEQNSTKSSHGYGQIYNPADYMQPSSVPSSVKEHDSAMMYDDPYMSKSSQSSGYGPKSTQSSGYGPMIGQQQVEQMFDDPRHQLAAMYGQNLAMSGSKIVNKNLEVYKTAASTKLKYYFTVDTTYVSKKLIILLFPFIHKPWRVQVLDGERAVPRQDVNAPDLYVPVLAFVTYVLIAGLSLGTQNRFSPEQLGITASTALVWTCLELALLSFICYLFTTPSSSSTNKKQQQQLENDVNKSAGDDSAFRYFDLLAYCGYKYVGMIAVLTSSLLISSSTHSSYYVALVYTSITLVYFLVRTFGGCLSEGGSGGMGHTYSPYSPQQFHQQATDSGRTRKTGVFYVQLAIAVTQPLLIWWLTRHLAITTNDFTGSSVLSDVNHVAE